VVEGQLLLQITIKNKFIKEFSSFRKFTIYFEYAKERFLTFNYLILPPSLAKYISHPIGGRISIVNSLSFQKMNSTATRERCF